MLFNTESTQLTKKIQKVTDLDPYLNIMTQGKVLIANFATKNGAFCISFSIFSFFNPFLYQDKQLH